MGRILTRKDYRSQAVGDALVPDALRAAAGDLPGLLHYIDPATLPATIDPGTEWAAGALVWRKETNVTTRVATEPVLNDLPGIDYGGTVGGATGGLYLGKGSVKPTWGMIGVFAIDATLRAAIASATANAVLLNAYSVGNRAGIKVTSAGFILYINATVSTAAGNTLTLPFTALPAGGEPFVLAASVDDASKTLAIRTHATALSTKVAAINSAAYDPGSPWYLGGDLPTNSGGWLGKGGVAIFTESYLFAAETVDKTDAVIAALVERYAIS